MPQQTALWPHALPGVPYSFEAKADAAPGPVSPVIRRQTTTVTDPVRRAAALEPTGIGRSSEEAGVVRRASD